jgi:hypothetical protein
MSGVTSIPIDSGLEVFDLSSDAEFAARQLHVRDIAAQKAGMHRIAKAFVEEPLTILQELVNSAVELCGADSAGISIEQENGSDENFYQWVATSGQYENFLNATLPRYPSACGTCLERGRPQLFRVGQRFFDRMGVDAPTVTDGILLPWTVEETRGTIWIMAHGRTEAFDRNDFEMMQLLADFAAMGVRHQGQQKLRVAEATAAATNALADALAHKINNPLQSLMNLAYLAMVGDSGGDAKDLAGQMVEHIERLSVLVKKMLDLPLESTRSK